MKLSQVYQILGWPLRCWRPTTLPPAPPVHDIPFDDVVCCLKARADRAAAGPCQDTENQEFHWNCAAMEVRYVILKQKEANGVLSAEEVCELRAMETGKGWCLDSPDQIARSQRR